MEALAQRQATQLRLNAELDAGALATISDMESCLRAPLSRPSNANGTSNKAGGSGSTTGGNAGRGNFHFNRSSNGNGSNARGRGRGRGRGKIASSAPGAALGVAANGQGGQPAMAVSRGPAWDNTSNGNPRSSSGTTIFSRDKEADGQLFRMGQEARGQPQPRSVVSVGGGATAGSEGGENEPGTPSPSSSLFRLSARVKEAARASGERTKMKAQAMNTNSNTTTRTASGSSLSLSSRPEDADYDYDYDYAHGHNTSEQEQEQVQEGSSLHVAGMRPGSSNEGRRGEQHHRLLRLTHAQDGEHHDRNRDNGNGHDADNAVIPGGAVGVPVGIGDEATARFLKAKLTSCQAQLEEVLQAHQTSQQEALELRRQSASDQEQLRRVTRQLQQLQQTKTKESKAKEEESLNAASLSARVAELERELGSFGRAARQSETDKKSLEVRLHRALEEISKQKEAVRQTRGQHKDVGQGQRLEVSRLEGQCQRLERQKLELLSAFKKQLKLIDVLKRQKFHVEAARMLGFTEEDFVKTLDWDSR